MIRAGKAKPRQLSPWEQDHPALEAIGYADEAFLRALCELMEIEPRRKKEPIVVVSPDPTTIH